MIHIFIVTLLIIFILLLLIKIIEVNTLLNKENFTDVSKCHGKRDGVSGCRTCCSNKYPSKYSQCVNECMN